MSLATAIKSNKKTILIVIGVIIALVGAYMGYLWWRRKLQPQIIAAQPVSTADEIAFNDMVAIIKKTGGGASTPEGLSAILNKAGDDFTAYTANASYGYSKAGALMNSVDYYYNNPTARPPISTKTVKIRDGIKWMSSDAFNQLSDRWEMYSKTAV